MLRPLTCLLTAAWASVALLSCSSTKASAPAAGSKTPVGAPVKVARAETRRVPVDLATVGNAEALSTIVVRAQIGGVLGKVHFEEGQIVKAGDPLFESDPRPYLGLIRQWEANLAREQAQLKLAEANLARAESQAAHYGKQAERYSQLADQGIFSREQSDLATVEARARRTGVRAETANIESVKAAIRADEVSVASAKLNLSYCSIKSPITGRTGAIRAKEGNLVKANDMELVTIHQIQPIYVTFSVPEEHLLKIRQRSGKLPVLAGIPGDTRPPAQGSLTFLDNAVDNTTGTIRLKATFSNSDGRYWPGQFVDVKLRLEDRPDAVVIPGAALQTGQQGNFVYVVKPDNSVELRVVMPGPRLDTLVSLTQGLATGETVVTEGQLRLTPGSKVTVMP